MSAPIVLPDEQQVGLKQAMADAWAGDRARLLVAQPFIGILAMNLEIVVVVDDRLCTAGTDGTRVFGDARFMSGLSEQARTGLLAHEIWHCALRHFLREGSRDSDLWNLAIDHEVNGLLLECGMTLPESAVYFSQHHGKNAETVYELLWEKKETAMPMPPTAGRHVTGEGLPPSPDLNTEGGQGAESETGSGMPDKQSLPLVVDPDFKPLVTKDAARRWQQRVVAAAQQCLGMGSAPSGVQRLIDELVEPRVPWQRVLARFVTTTFGGGRRWLPPSRRHAHAGVFLPSCRQESIDLVVAVDTSGSTQMFLERFLGEISGIMGAFRNWTLRVLMCDADVHHDEQYSEGDLPDPRDLPFPGGGGTSFIPVFEAIQGDNPYAMVFLTDGYGSAPDKAPPYPVLWALTPNGERPAEWGDVVQLD